MSSVAVAKLRFSSQDNGFPAGVGEAFPTFEDNVASDSSGGFAASVSTIKRSSNRTKRDACALQDQRNISSSSMDLQYSCDSEKLKRPRLYDYQHEGIVCQSFINSNETPHIYQKRDGNFVTNFESCSQKMLCSGATDFSGHQSTLSLSAGVYENAVDGIPAFSNDCLLREDGTPTHRSALYKERLETLDSTQTVQDRSISLSSSASVMAPRRRSFLEGDDCSKSDSIDKNKESIVMLWTNRILNQLESCSTLDQANQKLKEALSEFSMQLETIAFRKMEELTRDACPISDKTQTFFEEKTILKFAVKSMREQLMNAQVNEVRQSEEIARLQNELKNKVTVLEELQEGIRSYIKNANMSLPSRCGGMNERLPPDVY